MSNRTAFIVAFALLATLLVLPPPLTLAQHRNIGGPADYFLRERLSDRFLRDPELTAEQLTVILVNGGVVLSGPISTCNLRLRALSTAAAMRGIINVTDLMEVSRSDLPDRALRDAVEQVLEERKESLVLRDLEISVEDTVLTLEGSARDFFAVIKAEEAAGTVLGVTRIVNKLRPADAPSGEDDKSIADALFEYLSDSAQFPHAARMQVKVQDGVARLTGTTRLYLGLRQASLMTVHVGGVQQVDSRLRVDPGLDVMRVEVRKAD